MAPPGRRLRLAPSLLSADFADLAGAIRAAEEGGADAFHLDVMDGHFVPNISFGPALVAAVRRRTRLPLDIHLMIDSPETFVEPFARAGGDTLVFHLESTASPGPLIERIQGLKVGAGLAIRPDTPFDRASPFLPKLDQLLVMSVHPGFSGQSFIPDALPKLRAARRALDDLGSSADLSVDGGITTTTAADAARSGATFFVCGNSVFAGGPIVDNLRDLRKTIEAGASGAVL